MTKRKRFFVPQSLQQGMSDTIKAAENHAGNVRFEVISLKRIEPDPQNPRELKLLPIDIYNGIDKSAPHYLEKSQEMESLRPLSETIKQKGLINPVVVYKHGEFYRLVAGERRFLASILAQRDDIQARVLNEKPNGLNLRLLQWIENTEREDLSLRDRIGNVRSILDEYEKANSGSEVTATLIKELIGISLPQATYYLSVLRAPKDLEEQITAGKVNSLDKAAFLSKISQDDLRKKAIDSCVNGSNLNTLKNMVVDYNAASQLHNQSTKLRSKKSGRAYKHVSLGKTASTQVVKKIIHTVLQSSPKYKNFESRFSSVDWERFDETTKVFRDFLIFLEREGN